MKCFSPWGGDTLCLQNLSNRVVHSTLQYLVTWVHKRDIDWTCLKHCTQKKEIAENKVCMSYLIYIQIVLHELFGLELELVLAEPRLYVLVQGHKYLNK